MSATPDLFAAQFRADINRLMQGKPLRRVETPIARTSDPESSHLAAAEITASGKRAHQQAQTIAAVKAYPGRTSQELCELTGLDRYMLARRLPECVTAGAVRKGALTECTVTRKKALTWWPVDRAITEFDLAA